MKLQGRNSQSEPQGIFNENLKRSFDKLTASRSNQANTPQHRVIQQKPQVQLTASQPVVVVNKKQGK